MARPKKNTVDYFPHYANHKSTMFIIENKYGNDGYAFIFKMLELLAITDNHYFDCRKSANWKYLQARTRLSDNKCNEILNDLVELDMIDRELWQQFRVIWCDNFIKGISDVYRNRRVEIPQKPVFKKRVKPTTISLEPDIIVSEPTEESKPEEIIKISEENKKVNEFIKKYCESFKKIYNVNPIITKRDVGIVKRLINIPQIDIIMEKFFISKNKFILQNRHSLNIIESQLNILLVESKEDESKFNNIIQWLEEGGNEDDQERVCRMHARVTGNIHTQ